MHSDKPRTLELWPKLLSSLEALAQSLFRLASFLAKVDCQFVLKVAVIVSSLSFLEMFHLRSFLDKDHRVHKMLVCYHKVKINFRLSSY